MDKFGQRALPVIAAAVFLISAVSAAAAVCINEFAAAGSDRLLLRETGRYPRVGMTTPWHMPDYNDTEWKEGSGPFGFGAFDGVVFGVNTAAEMQGQTPSLYMRREFTVAAPYFTYSWNLRMNVRYNDGFIAFLNGVEVARRNMGPSGMFAYHDQAAFNPNNEAVSETITLGACRDLLREGTNVFAVQVHNRALTGSDALNLLMHLEVNLALFFNPHVFIAPTDEWRYFVGVLEPSGGVIDYGILEAAPVTVPWAVPGFNDSSWPQTPGPVGFDSGSDYILGTNLYSEMHGIAASVYARTRFVPGEADVGSDLPLELEIDYDDAIIVYLNGVEVARRNIGVPGEITAFDALALGGHNANGDGGGSVSGREEIIPLPAAGTLLRTGVNVLSVQIHNSSLTSSDLIGRVILRTTGPSAHELVRPEDECRFFVGLSEPVAVEDDDDTDVEAEAPDSESDWIELYNSGSNAVDLAGWSLTDNAGSPRKWLFPTGAVIQAGGYLLVLADGSDLTPDDGASYYHAGFKLDGSGEYVGLFDCGGVVVDEISPGYPVQSPFYSCARGTNGVFSYCDTATPGFANSGGFLSKITDPPVFSREGGHYSSGFTLQLGAPDAEAQIRYTLDGSEPSALNGITYTGPFSVSGNTVVRARCVKPGEVPSSVLTRTYLIAEPSGMRSVAAVCVNADPALAVYGPNAAGGPPDGEGILSIKGGAYVDSLWNYNGDTAAYNIPMQRGRAFEKPASLEVFPLTGSALGTDFGLRVSGSNHVRPRYLLQTAPDLRFPDAWANKPSFNFFFRDELGSGLLDYPLFPGYRIKKFEDVRLRAGKNDVKNPFIRDELMRRIFIGTGQEGSMGIFAALYINGVYKGYYNLCEHLREAFMQQHFNSDKPWDVIQVYDFANGDATRWNEMISFLRQSDMTATSSYCQVHGYLDVDNFIDYLLVNTYAATWDWPHNNWVAGSERSAEGRWRFFVWDAEGGFMSNRDPAVYDSFSTDLDIGSAAMTSTHYIKVIYTILKNSPEFRLRFADRVLKQAFGNGPLTGASMTARYVELRDAINPIMQATNDQTVNETFYNDWIATNVRRNAWFGQLAAHGLWPSVAAPQFTPEGGEVVKGVSVTVTNPNSGGTIYYTTNGLDPRACGGGVAGQIYAGALTVNSTLLLKARVLGTGGGWSPLREAYFIVPVDEPVFLPTGDGDWTADENWSSFPASYPDGAGVNVLIGGPPEENRAISLYAPVTVNSMTFDMHGCLFRNRIRDRDDGNTLTFDSVSGAAGITVNGIGPGFVEFEVEAGTVLNRDLHVTVNNTMGDSDYGAIRFRENWLGPGGIWKNGAGVLAFTGDTKAYTGSTVIEQGVLQITEPACPRQSTLVDVKSGGQLRLSSSGTAAQPRVYWFSGVLMLGSMGRGGDLPALSGLGVGGGLRYDPGDVDSHAVVSNTVAFSARSCIHVEGTGNSLTLVGPLYGLHGFVKSGGGILGLEPPAPAYSAPITVSNGVLRVKNRLYSAVSIQSGGVLTGCGRTGPLQGTGSVSLNGTVFESSAAAGLNYEMSFAQSGSPDYAQREASGNSVLRLASIGQGDAPSSISVFLDTPTLVTGSRLRGGIFVEGGGRSLADFLAAASVSFFVPDESGSRSFAGRLWAPYAGSLTVTATAMPETADFGDGPRVGQIIEIRIGGPCVSFGEWVQLCFTNPADRADPGIAGPLACPSGDGTVNLRRYAFDIGAYETLPGHLPSFAVEAGVPVLDFFFDPGKNDLTLTVDAGLEPAEWSRTLFDSRTDDLSRWNGERVRIYDTESGPSVDPAQYYRLRLQLDEP